MNEQEAKLLFGKALRKIRSDRNLTVRGFAKVVGFSAVYISDLENGNRKPTLEMINIFKNKLFLTEEEFKSLQKGYLFAHPENVIPIDVMYYILENNLIDALKTLETIDKKGTKIKKMVLLMNKDKEN